MTISMNYFSEHVRHEQRLGGVIQNAGKFGVSTAKYKLSEL